jgi:SpoVK/Ycf46/Vps4 family AAA+-type ATPase
MATNRLDTLDPALLRPGRIDRKIFFPEPSLEARADILKIHSRKMNLTKDVDLKKIAEKMPVTSGAEVKAVCTEAGMFALRERRTHVNMEDFELAVAKVCPFSYLRSSHRLLPDWTTKKRAFKNYGSNRQIVINILLCSRIQSPSLRLKSFLSTDLAMTSGLPRGC